MTALGTFVTKISTAHPPAFMCMIAVTISDRLDFSSFSAWGVTGISFGILLVCCWSRWCALVFVGLVGICGKTSKRLNAACDV